MLIINLMCFAIYQKQMYKYEKVFFPNLISIV